MSLSNLSPNFCASQGPWGSCWSGLVYNWWLFSASLLSPPWRLISRAKCPLVKGHTHLFNWRHPLEPLFLDSCLHLQWAFTCRALIAVPHQRTCELWKGPPANKSKSDSVCHKINIQDTQFRTFRFIAIKSTMSTKVEILLGPWGPGKWWHGAEFGRKIENL